MLVVLALAIIVGGCSQGGGKVVVISYQKAVTESCKGCEKCGVDGKEIQKAADVLKDKLAAKKVKVKIVEKKNPAAKMSNLWVCDIPLETWLGAQTNTSSCGGCTNPTEKMTCNVMTVDGQNYETVPAELIVRAGLMAADMLIEKGKIDPAAIKTPKGCAGCPSKGSCGMAK